MKRAIVVDTHPEDNSVDLVMSDGRRVAGVQVMAAPGASARTGSVGLPEVPPKKDKWDITQLDGQDIVAIVDYADDIPLVVGFLYPQISQMTFADKQLALSRHQSDFMTSIESDGSVQVVHPNGTYLRIGVGADMADFAGKNFDETLAVDRNTDQEITVCLKMGGGVMSLTISPDGTVDLVTESSVNVTASEVNIDVESTVNVTAPDSINFTTPLLAITGDVTVGGMVTAQGDVIGAGVSLETHLHAGVIPGPSVTTPPIPTA